MFKRKAKVPTARDGTNESNTGNKMANVNFPTEETTLYPLNQNSRKI